MMLKKSELELSLCLDHFPTFFRHAWKQIEGTKLYSNWHIDEIGKVLQSLTNELLKARKDDLHAMQYQNALFNQPPRTGKTIEIQVAWPAWIWVLDPSISIRCLSATGEVLQEAAENFYTLITSEWYEDLKQLSYLVRNVEPWSVDSDAMSRITNTANGKRTTTGLAAKVTGVGSDVIIIDDPHDAKDVMSDTKRNTVLSKYKKSVRNRVNNQKACLRIGVMQRLHELDWSGYVLGSSETWLHAKICQEYEERERCKCPQHTGKMKVPFDFRVVDPRSKDGELLHAERFDNSFVVAEQLSLGSTDYAGQHAQHPAPADGGLFKKKSWRFWYGENKDTKTAGLNYIPEGTHSNIDFNQSPAEALPDRFDEVVLSLDSTFGSEAISADFVALFVVGVKGANRFVLDRVHAKMSYTKTKSEFIRMSEKWPMARRKIVEKAASGLPLYQDLNGIVGGIVLFTSGQHGNKVQRANFMTAPVESGNWFLPLNAYWIDQYIDEFAMFPNAIHDDSVDACSQIEIALMSSPDVARLRQAYG